MEKEKSSYPVPGKIKEGRAQAGAGTQAGLRNLVKDMPDNLFLCVVLEEGHGKKKPV